MPTLNDLKHDLRNVHLPKLDLPKWDLPKWDLPELDLTKLDLTRLDLPIDADRVGGVARDAAYVGIGAVVVTAQKLEEGGRKLAGIVSKRVR